MAKAPSTEKKPPLVCPGHKKAVVKLCFSEETCDEDEPFFLASASHDRSAMLRSGTAGDWIGTFEGHRGGLWDVSINADATRVVTGGADFTSRVFDATTGDTVATRFFDHAVKVTQPHWGENKLVVCGNFGSMKIFDLATNAPATSSVTTGRISKGAFPTPSLFVAAGAEGACLWDVRTAEKQGFELAASGEVVDLEVVGSKLLVALPAAVLLYDISGPAPKLETNIPIKGGTVRAASLNPLHARSGFDQVVTAEGDRKLRVWNFKGELLDELVGHEAAVAAVRFSPTGDCASGSDDASVRLWSIKERINPSLVAA